MTVVISNNGFKKTWQVPQYLLEKAGTALQNAKMNDDDLTTIELNGSIEAFQDEAFGQLTTDHYHNELCYYEYPKAQIAIDVCKIANRWKVYTLYNQAMNFMATLRLDYHDESSLTKDLYSDLCDSIAAPAKLQKFLMMKLIVATLNSPDRGEAFFDDIRNVLALEETCKEASYDYMGGTSGSIQVQCWKGSKGWGL